MIKFSTVESHTMLINQEIQLLSEVQIVPVGLIIGLLINLQYALL